jgi:membrane associated rhomboid family serine protease
MSNYISPGAYNVLPPVVKNLLIINGLLFLAKMAFPSVMHIKLEDILGLHYWGSQLFYPFQFITYMFMHGDFSHILFNMFALWMFGSTLENYWGAKRFLIFYFITGIGAALVHYTVFYFQVQPTLTVIDGYLADPDFVWFKAFINSPDFVGNTQIIDYYNSVFVPAANSASSDAGVVQASVDFMNYYRNAFLDVHNVVGASGAIYGLLLAFGMTFPNSLIYIYFLFPIKAKWFVIVFGAIELFSGIRNNPTDNVAHFAHLGGMLFGLFLILLWKRKDINRHFNQF